ncbi:MAG: ribonuclease HII [Balneolaceae bacterium]
MDKYEIERRLWNEDFNRVMGLDEVGRGCLSGPVVAAGVILKPGEEQILGIDDSKKIPAPKRRVIAEEIKKRSLFWTIQQCSPAEIDNLNILHASIKAMMKCAESKIANPDYLLVDGNRFTSSIIPYSCVIKGDDKSASIGAASILAKVYRDELMHKLHEEVPYYGWDSNMGYPTKVHFEGLQKYGYSKYHRRSFKLRTDKVLNI